MIAVLIITGIAVIVLLAILVYLAVDSDEIGFFFGFFALVILFIFTRVLYDLGFKNGQVDAIEGRIKYRKVTVDQWEEIKSESHHGNGCQCPGCLTAPTTRILNPVVSPAEDTPAPSESAVDHH